MRVVLDTGGVIELGTTETAPTIGITDYSRRVTDDYGVTTVVERGFARRMSVRLGVPFDQADALQRTLADLRAQPATWIADERFGSLSFRGFYKDFSLDLATPPLSLCTLTIEGLVATEAFVDTGEDPALDGASSTLQLLRPVAIGTAQLLGSTVAEADAPEWQRDTTYALGARVIVAATHRVYESVAGANIGNDPASASGKWIDIGPTNRWAMFDQALGTATQQAGSIVVSIDAGTPDAVALLDVVADTIRVQAPGYDRTLPAGDGAVTFLDLPRAGGQVTVTIAGRGDVAIGTLLVGAIVPLGMTEASPTAAITDFSRKNVDEFGEVTIVERAWAKRMTANALIRTNAVDLVAGRIAAVRALPSLWIGQDGLDSLTVYGFFKDFSVEVGETVSKLALSIEGLSKAAPVLPFAPGGSVAWPDVTDPTGTKPADNADVTGENTSKDTNAVGGKPASDVLQSITELETVTIPAVNAAVAQADARITAAAGDAAAAVAEANAQIAAANGRVTAAQATLDQAVIDLANEILRAQGKDEELVQRIDAISAGGGYDDTDVRALIERAETVRADNDRALANRIDTVVTSYQDLDTATNTRITQQVSALSSADQALGLRIDSLQSTYVRGITPNADFSAGSANWLSTGFDFPSYGDGKLASSTPGVYCSLFGDAIPLLDANRAFRLHANFRVFEAQQLTYCGLQVLDSAGGFLANIYAPRFTQILQPGTYVVDELYQGIDPNLPAPSYGTGGRFPPNAYSVRPLFLANYPDAGGPFPGGYVQITSFWVEDVEAAVQVDARVSSVATTLSDADGALARRIDSVTADYQGRDLATNTRITDTAITLADATTAVGQRATVLESQASPSGGNLVPNSSLSTLDGWSLSANPDALTSLSLNGAGATWMIGGVENNLTMFRGPAGAGLCSEVQSSPFAVRAGSTIQAYAFTASHRCRAWVSVFFLRSAEFLGYAGENFGARINAGGQDINAHDQTGVMEYVVPAGATYAILVLRAYDVENDGYAWFSRPFVTEVRPGTKTWAPYSAGNDRGVAAATRALVSSTATTLADADRAIGQRIDSVTADYQGRDANTNARVDQVATSSASANQAVADLTTSVSTRFDGVYGTLGSYDQRITSLSTDQQGYVGRTSTLEAQMSRQAPSALNTFTDDVNNRLTQVDTNVNARIKSSEDVIADLPNRYAAASRTATLEAQVNNAADSGLQRTVNARIEERAAAIADDRAGAVASTLAQLRAEYNGAAAVIAQQAGAIAGIDGRTSVFWSITGTTPDGSTRISLSKSDGSAGVFYIGANLVVDGNAIFNGTVTIHALDRSTMTATTASSVAGSYGGPGQASKQYIPDLGADMFIRSGGSIYIAFSGFIYGTTNGTRDTQPTFEILNAADNGILATVPLPEIGFGNTGRLDNYMIRVLNTFGELTIRWRVAVRTTERNWSTIRDPALSVYWTAL